MDTDSLRLFVRAAEKLNISAAGRELGIAPAVASTRLAKLESEIGTDLLHRSTRKVSLSLDGAEFLPFAREILSQTDASRAALGFGNATPTGILSFTAPSTFAQLYITPILPKFFDAYPNIDLDLRLSDTKLDLIEGSFDLALRNTALSDSSLKGRKLADDVRVLCAAPDYVQKFGPPQTPSDLEAHQIVQFKGMTKWPLCGKDGKVFMLNLRQARSRLMIDDGLCQKTATLAGAGISVNSIWSVHKEITDGRLVRILPNYTFNDNSVLWLVYPKSNVLTSKVRVFIDFLVQNLGRDQVWAKTEVHSF